MNINWPRSEPQSRNCKLCEKSKSPVCKDPSEREEQERIPIIGEFYNNKYSREQAVNSITLWKP